MSENVLRQGLTRYLSPAQLEALRAARVGVAGAGGLGSNAALMLARSGVEHFLLIDDDVVDASNLNRQQFWPRHLGRPKVEALAELVRELNPDARVETCRLRIDAANVDELVARCPLWLEALDGACWWKRSCSRAAASPVPRAWAVLAASPCKSACWAIWCWWATSRPTSSNIRPWPRA